MAKIYHRRILPLALVALWHCCCLAAGPGIGLTLVGYTLNKEPHSPPNSSDYVLSIQAQLTNFDSTLFTGPIDFALSNNGGNISSQHPNALGKPHYSGTVITLNPQESVPAVFDIHIGPEYFAPGPDVVVVWPISGFGIADSVVIPLIITTDTVYYDNPVAGIQETEVALFSYAISQNQIVLLNINSQIDFKQVRIYTLLGVEVSALQSDHITEIPLPQLPKGIYLCQLTTATGQTRMIKFFH